MRWRIVIALLVCLPLAGGASTGGSAKQAPDKEYAKVELKGYLGLHPQLPGNPQIPTLVVNRQVYELDLSKLKVQPKKEVLDVDLPLVIVHGSLRVPDIFGGGTGKLKTQPLVVVTKLMVIYE